MSNRLHGSVTPAEALGKNFDFFTVQTTLDITPTGVTAPKELTNPKGVYPFTAYNQTFANALAYDAAHASQKRLDKLFQVVGTRAQPVILGDVVESTEAAPVTGLPVTNSLPSGSNVTVYTVKFVIEHAGAWDTPVTLADSLNGVEGFVYTIPTTGNNVSVTKNELL